MICATACKRRRPREADPHYRCASPMRLSVEADVLRLPALLAAARDGRRCAVSARAIREAAEAECAAYAGVRGGPARPAPAAGPLPSDVLGVVLRKLAASVELDGIRGAGVVARDLCHAAAASKLMRAAAQDGFAELGRQAERDGGRAWPGWDRFFEAPLALRARELKDAARDAGVAVGGPKAVVAARLLSHLRTPFPPRAPASAVLAVSRERYAVGLPPAAAHRMALLGLLTRAMRSGTRRDACFAAAAIAGSMASLPEPPGPAQRACRCGNLAASACAKRLCVHCCRSAPGACQRHAVAAPA